VQRSLRSMRVFVQCSRSEGFSGALLEAASAGVPIVSKKVGGVHELLAASPNGPSLLAVEEADMSEAIERVLRDRELAISLSAAARQAASTFSADRERDCWLDIHRKTLAGSARFQAPPVRAEVS
jgi:L-malate glycosyltransferase